MFTYQFWNFFFFRTDPYQTGSFILYTSMQACSHAHWMCNWISQFLNEYKHVTGWRKTSKGKGRERRREGRGGEGERKMAAYVIKYKTSESVVIGTSSSWSGVRDMRQASWWLLIYNSSVTHVITSLHGNHQYKS